MYVFTFYYIYIKTQKYIDVKGAIFEKFTFYYIYIKTRDKTLANATHSKIYILLYLY